MDNFNQLIEAKFNYQQQLTQVTNWLKRSNHTEICQFLSALVKSSPFNQYQFLNTTLQPNLHRDFMYAANKEFPDDDFTPLSTHRSRTLKRRLEKRRYHLKFHRIDSAFLERPSAFPTESTFLSNTGIPDGRSLRWSIATPPVLSESVVGLPGDQQVNLSSRCRTGNNLSFSYNLEQKTDKNIQNQVAPSYLSSAPSRLKSHMMSKVSSEYARPMLSQNRHASSNYVISGEHNDVTVWKRSRITRPRTVPTSPTRTVPTSSTGIMSVDQANSRRSRSVTKTSISLNISVRPRVMMMTSSVTFDETAMFLNWYVNLWTDCQRNDFLRSLLVSIDARQQYFLTKLIIWRKYVNILIHVPKKVVFQILSYLRPRDTLQASQVCKAWHKLCLNQEVWREKYQRVYSNSEHNLMTETSRRPQINWLQKFKEKYQIEKNWRENRFKKIECCGHTDRVLSVTFDLNRMASGSRDRTIKIWSLQSGSCLLTLYGHQKGVWCLHFFTESLLISASYDTSIRIWNLRNRSCARTLIGHTGPVWAIARHKHVLLSGSHDSNAKLWDLNHCTLLHTLRGHTAPVFCVEMSRDGKHAVTGSADKTVRIWDALSGHRLQIACHQPAAIMSVKTSPGFLACSAGTTVYIYALSTDRPTLIRKFIGHSKRIECIFLRSNEGIDGASMGIKKAIDGAVISAGKDGLLNYWDLESSSKRTFDSRNKQINCIHLDERRLASASYDHKIHVWDFTIPARKNNAPPSTACSAPSDQDDMMFTDSLLDELTNIVNENEE